MRARKKRPRSKPTAGPPRRRDGMNSPDRKHWFGRWPPRRASATATIRSPGSTRIPPALSSSRPRAASRTIFSASIFRRPTWRPRCAAPPRKRRENRFSTSCSMFSRRWVHRPLRPLGLACPPRGGRSHPARPGGRHRLDAARRIWRRRTAQGPPGMNTGSHSPPWRPSCSPRPVPRPPGSITRPGPAGRQRRARGRAGRIESVLRRPLPERVRRAAARHPPSPPGKIETLWIVATTIGFLGFFAWAPASISTSSARPPEPMKSR